MDYKDLSIYYFLTHHGCSETTGPQQKKEGTVRISTGDNYYVYNNKLNNLKKVYSDRNMWWVKCENYGDAFFLIMLDVLLSTKSSRKIIDLSNIGDKKTHLFSVIFG